MMKILILLCFVAGALGESRVCGRNERYYECGTACPLTCDNFRNPPKICPAMCVIGCQCAQGYVKSSDGSCVLPVDCHNTRQIDLTSEVCELPAKPGNCLAYFQRYYYDTTTGECKKFIFGGCGGNGNNFKTMEDCERICGIQRASQAECDRYPDSGLCDAYMPRYFYDPSSGTCKTFVYGGCGGNTNNFKTEEECIAECVE